MKFRDLDKAALRGEPSYIWRAGQERRLNMIIRAAGNRLKGRVLENGCGVGIYLQHLAAYCGSIIGLEYDWERLHQAQMLSTALVNAACEDLPFGPHTFDVILSHEVIEHVRDDLHTIREMVRVLKPGGVIILFAPNRGYPVETHGFYWHGQYHFGNIPMLHYLPLKWQKRLVPHVRSYTSREIDKLFDGLPVNKIKQEIIFGAYDNIIFRFPTPGRILRKILQWLESTPLKIFGLSHFWVVEKA